MENVWEKLKAIKGRSWIETKDILNKIVEDIHHVEEIIKTYKVNSETLPQEDKEIYGVNLKSEPFYLERCKLCSHLFKPSVISRHYDMHYKRNTNVKKSPFISPNKKKYQRKNNKSTSEDDSESIISSETSSPVIDSQENQSSDSNLGTIRDDSIVDIISVDEIPSEDSKPPTPGPQDLYEEFAVPCTEEIPVYTSAVENLNNNIKTVYTNPKTTLKLKITSNKDLNQKSQNTTSLLEAHLLSNTKYTTTAHSNSDLKYRNSNYKFSSTFIKNENQISNESETNLEKSEENFDTADVRKCSFLQSQNVLNAAKLKTETKISIPISVLPQNVKIIGSLKKTTSFKSQQQLKTNGQKSILNADSKEKPNPLPSSYKAEAEENTVELCMPDTVKEKLQKSKRNKRSKGKNRSTKNMEFDPNKHCGVLIDENKHCMRSLTCKTHAIALRRAVEGRSKEFDKLLADHRASKEALKEQERSQNYSLSEPIISIPILSVDKISGNTIQIPSANNEPEIIKIRVPNIITNSQCNQSNSNVEKYQNDNNLTKLENEKVLKKITSNVKLSNVFNAKSTNNTNKIPLNTSSANSETKSDLHENDIKISFVCSDMLYKVGGLLYMDRSRQAIRKCMEPLILQNKEQVKRPLKRKKITDFLNLVKNCNKPPMKLNIFKDEKSKNVLGSVRNENLFMLKHEIKLKAKEELERMKNVLVNSSKILNNLSSDENEIKKLKISRKLKHKIDRGKNINIKKIKQDSISEENYDINTLLSFDKSVNHKTTNDIAHFSVIASDGYSFGGAQNVNMVSYDENIKNSETQQTENLSNISNMIEDITYNVYLNNEHPNSTVYSENDAANLLQTFKDLENEIRSTVGTNMQELYPPQTLPNNVNTAFINFINSNSSADNINFKENCDNEFKVIDTNVTNLEETISKDYSLLEEYCKNISTDELFLDNKTDFEFYENDGSVNANNIKMNKNDENLFNNERPVDHIVTANTVDNLNFDTHLLNSYLSSISNEVNNQNSNDISFTGGRQFDIAQIEMQDPPLSKERVYEKILTLNKQYQDNAAVNIDKPPTPTPVFGETENEEVLKWLF